MPRSRKPFLATLVITFDEKVIDMLASMDSRVVRQGMARVLNRQPTSQEVDLALSYRLFASRSGVFKTERELARGLCALLRTVVFNKEA